MSSGVFATLSTEDHSYVGHKLTSVIIAAIPGLVRINSGEVLDRLLLAACGGIGAAIAIASDRPKNWQEACIRVGVGTASCVLFCPYIAARLSFDSQIDALIATAGVMGVISWYVMGSTSRFLRWLGTSDVVGTLIKLKTGIGPEVKPEAKRETETPAKT